MRRRQKDIGRSNFLWLSGAFHRRATSKLGDLFRVLVRGVKGRPYGAGCNCVYAYPTPDQIAGQGACKRIDPSLGHRVVDEIFVSQEPGNRSGVQDRRSGLHMLDASLGHIEIAVQIGLNGVIEMLLGEILESGRMNLKRRVVYKHIESAKFAQRLCYCLAAEAPITDVAGNQV